MEQLLENFSNVQTFGLGMLLVSVAWVVVDIFKYLIGKDDN